MAEQINIIQFMPYFPPHKWWLETHWEQWANWWMKKQYWKVYNVVTDFNQSFDLWTEITYNETIIWYKKNDVENLIVPSFEIILGFPFYNIWSKEYRLILKYLESKEVDIIITRTRFFLTSYLWWRYAKRQHINWVHIEHGSGFIKLNSQFKNIVAKIYDRLIWKWIFINANKVVWVSDACKWFIQKNFINRQVDVIYRWIEQKWIIEKTVLKDKFPNKIIVWFVGRLFKWKNVESLIKAYYLLDEEIKGNIKIVIIWEWEDFETLVELDRMKQIYFTGWKNSIEALELQAQFDIHYHTSSQWWWLATTLLQAMMLGKFIIATPYEWAKEVIINWENGILLRDDSVLNMKMWLEFWLLQFKEKEGIYALKNNTIVINDFSWDKNILKYYKLFS